MSAALESVALLPNNPLPKTNLAHALLFTGRVGEAEPIYLSEKGKEVNGAKWFDIIGQDFDDLKAGGLSHPEMDRIEALLKE